MLAGAAKKVRFFMPCIPVIFLAWEGFAVVAPVGF
jgi:hypothetical protein